MRIKMKYLLAVFLLTTVFTVNAQQRAGYPNLRWNRVATHMPEPWYASEEAKRVADTVLKYQYSIGGWPKNHNFHREVKLSNWETTKYSNIGATIDNGATITEMRFLAKMYSSAQDERYKIAFHKGLEYILLSQYKNGGWPQFYPTLPNKGSYYTRITYNDNAMVNVMHLLKEIISDQPLFRSLAINADLKQQMKQAFDKGVDCILKTQIIVNGEPAIWCAQHDERTLLPAKARAYELASFSGAESVGIVLLLMGIENPSPAVVKAVKGAKSFFESHKIEGLKIQFYTTPDGLRDVKVVEDVNAPTLWARFYDLDTQKPFFCDRDGVKRATIAELSHDRRSGYSWYTNSPAAVLERYNGWNEKWVAR